MNDATRETEDELIASFPKNSSEEVRISRTRFRGHDLCSIRSWAEKKSGTFVPTKSGLSLRIGQVPLLIDALQKLLDAEQARREAA